MLFTNIQLDSFNATMARFIERLAIEGAEESGLDAGYSREGLGRVERRQSWRWTSPDGNQLQLAEAAQAALCWTMVQSFRMVITSTRGLS